MLYAHLFDIVTGATRAVRMLRKLNGVYSLCTGLRESPASRSVRERDGLLRFGGCPPQNSSPASGFFSRRTLRTAFSQPGIQCYMCVARDALCLILRPRFSISRRFILDLKMALGPAEQMYFSVILMCGSRSCHESQFWTHPHWDVHCKLHRPVSDQPTNCF
jgi:hypothetical protein